MMDLFGFLWRTFFQKELGLDEGITSWDLVIGFLVKNYPYGLIPRSKLTNPGQTIREFMFQKFHVETPIQRFGF